MEMLELLFQKLSSRFSKNFQLTFNVPKLEFSNLKSKIDLEYLLGPKKQKYCMKILKFKLIFKVRFLRRNDKMNRIENF